MVIQVAEKSKAPATHGKARDIPALDGLRGLAVLLVIWCHIRGFTFDSSTEWLLEFKAASGFIGLYLFFILSGFLLFLPYARALLSQSKWPDARRFYTRRVLRIIPVYYTALLVLIALAMVGSRWHVVVPPVPGKQALLFLFALFHDMRQDSWAFMLGTNTPLWSLAVEWQYYLVLPFLALGLRALHRRAGNKGLVAGLLGLMVYALIVRAIAAATFYSFGFPNVLQIRGPMGLALALAYGMNGKYLELFALGMLASVAYIATEMPTGSAMRGTSRGRAGQAGRAMKIATLVTSVCLLVVLPVNLVWLHSAGLIPTPVHAYVGRWPQEAAGAWAWSVAGPWLSGVCMAGLLIGTLLGPIWFRRLWTWYPLRLVGLISYSLYVWHALIQRVMDPYWTAHWKTAPAIWYVLAYILILILVGIASYRFIERPFLRLRKRETVRADRPRLGAVAS